MAIEKVFVIGAGTMGNGIAQVSAQAGYNVAFAPFEAGTPTGSWSVFADGFAAGDMSPNGAAHRPVGLAQGPDGSLFISDSQVGRIWRVMYIGS